MLVAVTKKERVSFEVFRECQRGGGEVTSEPGAVSAGQRTCNGAASARFGIDENGLGFTGHIEVVEPAKGADVHSLSRRDRVAALPCLPCEPGRSRRRVGVREGASPPGHHGLRVEESRLEKGALRFLVPLSVDQRHALVEEGLCLLAGRADREVDDAETRHRWRAPRRVFPVGGAGLGWHPWGECEQERADGRE